MLRVAPDDVGLLLLPHLDAGLPELEEGRGEVLVPVEPLLGGHEVVPHDVQVAVGLRGELVVELERHLAAVHDLDLAGAQLRDRRLRDDRRDLAVAAEQVRGVHEVVVDLEVEVAATDPVVEAMHLLREHAPEGGVRRRPGDADGRPLGHVGQRLVGVSGATQQRHAQVVVLAERDRLDPGLRLEHRRLPRRHRHDVAVTAGEVGEFVPGRARLDPGVILLLPVLDHPLVLHHVPDRLGGEREADHPFAVASPRVASVAARGGGQGDRGGGCHELDRPHVQGCPALLPVLRRPAASPFQPAAGTPSTLRADTASGLRHALQGERAASGSGPWRETSGRALAEAVTAPGRGFPGCLGGP